MLKEQGDGPHHDKKATQSGERHHQATSVYHRTIPVRYNPLEEVANINNLDKYFLQKLKPL